MRFRTEIEKPSTLRLISRNESITLLGSCFSDEIGQQLMIDGFNVAVNPFGPIYNPVTLSKILSRAVSRRLFTADDLTEGPRGWHALDAASRFSGEPSSVLTELNDGLIALSDRLCNPSTLILTLGTACVFTLAESGQIVGNCHKFPASRFTRRMLDVEEICDHLIPVLSDLSERGVRIIITISPIRHLADGLHGNTLSKSTLHLAAHHIINNIAGIEYFPAYEALMDDLRDYRFYAADMKHPSQVAVDYIYELFSSTYFSASTAEAAIAARREFKLKNHRQILPS